MIEWELLAAPRDSEHVGIMMRYFLVLAFLVGLASLGTVGEPVAKETWWSLRPLERPPVPSGEDNAVRNPVDAFVRAKLKEKGLTPAPAADRRTLIRRLSFDLLGLPPAPDEIVAFGNDTHPEAYERLVDRLLASPHYGERWA